MHAKKQKIIDELSYKEFYLENYEIIRQWALQITSYENDLADDIIQDVYLKLYQRECPQNYESIRAYIYACLKNGFSTQLRKKGISRFVSITDCAEVLENNYSYDPRSDLLAQDKIKEICDYICWRKETSIAASIFILRFFLGYNSKEISIIIKRRKNAIEARLVKIRHEISCLSKNSDWLTNSNPNTFSIKKNRPQSVWADLIQTIYSHSSGSCPTIDDYVEVYSTKNLKPDREMISHFVSCPRCLDRINRMLGLPKISDRSFFGVMFSAVFSLSSPFLCS